jgi:hypothetical protein
MMVDAYIARDPAGTCRIYCKRGKHKWWFELGRHRETDMAFDKALSLGAVHWKTAIQDSSKLF